jgi:hypothetical protein
MNVFKKASIEGNQPLDNLMRSFADHKHVRDYSYDASNLKKFKVGLNNSAARPEVPIKSRNTMGIQDLTSPYNATQPSNEGNGAENLKKS